MADEVQEEKLIDPFELFGEQTKIAVMGLSFIGQLTRTITYCGHSFTIRTLRPAEKAAISQAVKEYRDSIAEPEVWANAQVGLSLTEVDGVQDFCNPIGPALIDFVKGRLNYITNPQSGWYPPTLGYLYNQYLELEGEALEAVRELQNLSERDPAPPLPSSPDSLTGLVISDVPIDSDSES